MLYRYICFIKTGPKKLIISQKQGTLTDENTSQKFIENRIRFYIHTRARAALLKFRMDRLVKGSIVNGQMVPFPSIVRLPGEPTRVRVTPQGQLPTPIAKVPSKYVNFSLNGLRNARLPYLGLSASRITTCHGGGAGVGVFAMEQIRASSLVTEYGGQPLTRSEAEVLRAEGRDTHVIAILPYILYLDSFWSHINTPFTFMNGHYLGGFLNSAYYEVLCYEFRFPCYSSIQRS